jgi:hypothetical protein
MAAAFALGALRGVLGNEHRVALKGRQGRYRPKQHQKKNE